MRCKHCDARLAPHDFWCVNCGKQTPIVVHELASWGSFKRTFKQYWQFKGANIPAAAFAILVGVIPIIAFLVLLNAFGILDFQAQETAGKLLLNLFITGIGLSLLTPLLLIAFKPVCEIKDYTLTLKDLLKGFKAYPRYFFFSLITALYFILIYIICFGLPNFASDPILHLVWLVLVGYYIGVSLPVPILMERKKVNAWKAIRMAYKYFKVVRWQLFWLGLILLALNLAATALALVFLLITLPLSWFVIRDYIDLLLEYEIIREYKTK
jgi:hypothetical protein